MIDKFWNNSFYSILDGLRSYFIVTIKEGYWTPVFDKVWIRISFWYEFNYSSSLYDNIYLSARSRQNR